MKKSISLALAVIVLSVFAAGAFADFITSSTSGVDWRSWNSSILGTSGKPYWNNSSNDGSHYNVGYFLTKTGAFSSNPYSPDAALPFWGKAYTSGSGSAVGAADPNFYLTKDGGEQTAALLVEVAGFSNSNKFGWFETNATGTTLGAKHQIFSGADSPLTSVIYDAALTDYYGFYIDSPDGSFYTLDKYDSGGSDNRMQHFAAFREDGGTYWLGVEDRLKCKSDKDYNDMIIRISSVPNVPPSEVVPEPSTWAMLGIGLVGIVMFRKQKKS